jgi:hypothetical protein
MIEWDNIKRGADREQSTFFKTGKGTIKKENVTFQEDQREFIRFIRDRPFSVILERCRKSGYSKLIRRVFHAGKTDNKSTRRCSREAG